MGLDVGVVKVSYLDRPTQPMYDFLWQLVFRTGCEDWGSSWEGNAFVELERRRMLSKARAYAKKQALAKNDLDNLIAWVRSLPWDGDAIMLHLNW